MSSRLPSYVLAAVALIGLGAHSDPAWPADPAPAVDASPAEVAPDCGTATVEALFASGEPEAIVQSCTYTCIGTSTKLCPQFQGYTVSCVNGCCVYSYSVPSCVSLPECFIDAHCDEDAGERCNIYNCCSV